MDALVGPAKEILYTMALAMPRLVGAMTALSFLGSGVLGGALARNGIAAALALPLYPVVLAQIDAAGLTGLTFAAAAAKEFLLGLVIGMVVMVVFWCVQAVGNLIDNQRGATMASSMDPFVGEQSSPFGLFLTQSMVAVFFLTGLFEVFLAGIYRSYAMWPATSFWPALDRGVVDFFVAQFVLVSEMAVLVGGPVVVAMFLAELGLGFVSRFAPQLNVFFLSMPVKSGIACLMVLLFWSVVVLFFGDMLRDTDTLGAVEEAFS